MMCRWLCGWVGGWVSEWVRILVSGWRGCGLGVDPEVWLRVLDVRVRG